MANDRYGIWVRVLIEGNTEVTGFVEGAESPNDFFTTFKTQFVRLEDATEVQADGAKIPHETVYLNRDRVLLAKIVRENPKPQ